MSEFDLSPSMQRIESILHICLFLLPRAIQYTTSLHFFELQPKTETYIWYICQVLFQLLLPAVYHFHRSDVIYLTIHKQHDSVDEPM